MDADQWLRLIDILISWPAVALMLGLVFRPQITRGLKWLAWQIEHRESHVGGDGVSLGQWLPRPLPHDIDVVAGARALDSTRDQPLLDQLDQYARQRERGRAARIAERVKVLLETPETVFPFHGRTSISQVAFGPSAESPVLLLREATVGDMALGWVRVAFSKQDDLSDEYKDWVAAAELLREDGVPVSRKPFTEEQFRLLASEDVTGVWWSEG